MAEQGNAEKGNGDDVFTTGTFSGRLVEERMCLFRVELKLVLFLFSIPAHSLKGLFFTPRAHRYTFLVLRN